MTNKPAHIQLIRSNQTNKAPLLSDLLPGELALNISGTTPALYARTATAVIKIGPVYIGETYGSTPSLGELWFAPSTSTLKVWAGSSWYTIGGGGGGGGTAFTYTNPIPMPLTIGGLEAGTTFLDDSEQSLWDRLLYPYVPPSIGLNVAGVSGGTIEVGVSLPANSSEVMSITVSGPADNIDSVRYFYEGVEITDHTIGGSYSGSGAATTATYNRPQLRYTTPHSIGWTATALNTKGATINASLGVNWSYMSFVGIASGGISSIGGLASIQSGFGTPGAYAKPATSNAQYVIFVLAPGVTIGRYVVSGLDTGMVPQSGITINRNGVDIAYTVFATPNATYGTPTVVPS